MNNFKKIMSIIGIVIAFFIIYFLQVNFFSWFNIAGIKPNLFIVLILCIGLFAKRNVAIIFGFIFGIYLDFLTGKQVGITALVMMLIGFAGGYFDKNFSKDGKITMLLMVAGATFIAETIMYLYSIIINSISFELAFIRILLIEIIFNVLLTIILYPLISKLGYMIENVFKKSAVLTRYF